MTASARSGSADSTGISIAAEFLCGATDEEKQLWKVGGNAEATLKGFVRVAATVGGITRRRDMIMDYRRNLRKESMKCRCLALLLSSFDYFFQMKRKPKVGIKKVQELFFVRANLKTRKSDEVHKKEPINVYIR